MRTCTKCNRHLDDTCFRDRRTWKTYTCRECENRRKKERQKEREIEILEDDIVSIVFEDPVPYEPIESEDTDPQGLPLSVLKHAREEKDTIAQLRSQNKLLLKELKLTEERAQVITHLVQHQPRPIVPYGAPMGMREAVAVLTCSDWHVEEPVKSDSVNGMNEYSLDIAGKRIDKLVEGLLWKLDMYRSRYQIDTMVLALLGDHFSGYIHEELEETAQLSPVESVLWLEDKIRGILDALLEHAEMQTIWIPCQVGNHGRTTKKRRVQTNAENSFEWLMFRHLQSVYEQHPNIHFYVPVAKQSYMEMYGKVVRFTHGDDIRGGSGVGGITIPINKWIYRQDAGRKADVTVMGHFHTYINNPNLVVNGSLIGYNAYAMANGFSYEPASQAFFLLDSKRGKTESAPIWVEESDT